MIDRLLLRCSFTHPEEFSLGKLGIQLAGTVDPDGTLYGLRHVWTAIPSSFSSLAFKIFDHNDDRTNHPDPFIEINASPAKLAHGHNLYGTDDLSEAALYLLELLYETFPSLAEKLDYSTWEVAEIDITYHSWAEDSRRAGEFIRSLGNLSNGQTRARMGIGNTVYFGKKNSRLKKIKVYEKLSEVENQINKTKSSKNPISQYLSDDLKAWANGMIRWEATLKSRWFERRGIPTNLFEMAKQFQAHTYWQEATNDIFEALKGGTMKIIKDEKIHESLRALYPTIGKRGTTYTVADGAYRTYRAIRHDGYDAVKATMSKNTFYRHLDMILHCGLSKAALQNMSPVNQGAEIIPLVRYAVVEFRNQYPHFLKAA
jgi:II/X family phage/plasmid replication protein